MKVKYNKILDENKQKIIDLFNKNVKGVDIILDNKNAKHCGKEGLI